MIRNDGEPAVDWYARSVQEFDRRRREEDQHWQRLKPVQSGDQRPATPVFDDEYVDAVDAADQAQAEMRQAARAVDNEQQI